MSRIQDVSEKFAKESNGAGGRILLPPENIQATLARSHRQKADPIKED